MNPKTILVLAALACAAPAFAAEGGGAGSHGGDTLVSEFTGTARNLLKTIADLSSPAACPTAASLAKAIQETKVYSSPVVFIEGREHDARNDRQKGEIEISRVRMLNQNDDINYLTVVLHEYLGILGREDTNTTDQSQACLSALAQSNIDLKRLRYRMSAITTFEEAILSGHSRIECLTEGKEKATFTMTAPSLYSEAYPNRRHQSFELAFQRANGSEGRTYSNGETREEKYGKPLAPFFRLEYSIQTGTATWVFESEATNYGGIPIEKLTLSTGDHATWKLHLTPRRKKHQPVSASCTFLFVQ